MWFAAVVWASSEAYGICAVAVNIPIKGAGKRCDTAPPPKGEAAPYNLPRRGVVVMVRGRRSAGADCDHFCVPPASYSMALHARRQVLAPRKTPALTSPSTTS